MDAVNRKITWKFNLVVSLFILFLFLVEFLFSPTNDVPIPYDAFFDSNPITALLVAIFTVVLAVLLGSKLFQILWNNLIADLFKLREIHFQEALALGLFSATFFGSW